MAKLLYIPNLNFPDFKKPFYVQTDASGSGIGGVLFQLDDHSDYVNHTFRGKEKIIQFVSRVLQKSEFNYHATERELLAIVYSFKKMKPYLIYNKFFILTDSRSLVYLDKCKETMSDRMIRWSLFLSNFSFEVNYIPGEMNRLADMLSRNSAPFHDEDIIELEDSELFNDLDLIEPTKIEKVQMNSLLEKCIARLVRFEEIKINPEMIIKEQDNDNELVEIKNLLKTNPDNDLQFRYRLAANGILCQRTSNQDRWVVSIPDKLIMPILDAYHNTTNGSGHLGFAKTLIRLNKTVSFKDLRKRLKHYIASCKVCQLYKSSNQKKQGLMDHVKVSFPGEGYSLDLIGPMPKSSAGYEYGLVLKDLFSRYPEIYPLRSATAKLVVDSTLKFCSMFSFPKFFITDQGTQFKSKLFTDLAKAFGVRIYMSSPYHPQANPTEICNKEIKKQLSKAVADHHRRWPDYLRAILISIRSMINDSTGFSPSLLFLGREIHLPIDRILETDLNDKKKPYSNYQDYISRICKEMYDNVSIAMENIAKSQFKNKQRYDKDRKFVSFKTGEKVLLKATYLSNKELGFMASLAPKWMGPYTIGKAYSDITYELIDKDGKSRGWHHVCHLKLYIERDSDILPIESELPLIIPIESIDLNDDNKLIDISDDKLKVDILSDQSKSKKKVIIDKPVCDDLIDLTDCPAKNTRSRTKKQLTA